MKSLLISIIINAVFCFLGTFTLLVALLHGAQVVHGAKLALAIFIAILGCVIYLYFSTKSASRKAEIMLGNKRQKRLNELLISYNNVKLIDLFKALLEKEGICARKKGWYLQFENFAILPLFLPNGLSANVASFCIKRLPSCLRPVVITNTLDNDCILFLQAVNANAVTFKQVFCLVEKHFPHLLQSTQKTNKPKLFSAIKTRSNGKRFITYGLVLQVFSRFAFFPVYYLFCGSLFIILGLGIMFFVLPTVKNDFCLQNIKKGG